MIQHELDTSRIKKLKRKGDKLVGQCPACAEAGGDKKGDHLAVFDSGKFCCAAHPDDKAHSSTIWSYIGTSKRADDETSSLSMLSNVGPKLGAKPKPKKTMRLIATYDYTDRNGELLHQTLRYEPKTFRQRRVDPNKPGGYLWSLKGFDTVLYNLPAIASVPENEPVIIVEGEKDADNLNKLGYTATTAPMGAGKWLDSYTEELTGVDVVLIPDNDTSGMDHMIDVAERLEGVAKRVRVASLKTKWEDCPEKGDITDYLSAGESMGELIAQSKSAEDAEEEAKEVDRAKFADMMQGLIASTDENIMKMKSEVKDAVFVLPGIALSGTLTVLYAQYTTGKTLLTLWLLTQRDRETNNNAQIYYVNADDSLPEAIYKAELMKTHGVHSLIPGQKGFSTTLVEEIMTQAIDSGSAGSVVLVLDTLKKFTDLMEKRTLRTFNILCRNFAMAGGTVIGLAHTNKHTVGGESIAEGTGDVLNDWDCGYVIDKVPESPEDNKTIRFRNVKPRGACVMEALFTYNRCEGLTWRERFESVAQINHGEAKQVVEAYEAKRRHEADTEIINYLKKRICGSTEPVAESELTHHDLNGQPGSKAARQRVLYDYTQTNDNLEFQHWKIGTGQTGGKVFSPADGDVLL